MISFSVYNGTMYFIDQNSFEINLLWKIHPYSIYIEIFLFSFCKHSWIEKKNWYI